MRYLLIDGKNRDSKTFAAGQLLIAFITRSVVNVRTISNGFLLVSLVTTLVSLEEVCLPSFEVLNCWLNLVASCLDDENEIPLKVIASFSASRFALPSIPLIVLHSLVTSVFLVPTISAYTRWNCLANVYNYRSQQIEINIYPDSPLFISTGSTIIHALISCRLDYCNYILYNVPKSKTDRLQRLQNQCARILTKF